MAGVLMSSSFLRMTSGAMSSSRTLCGAIASAWLTDSSTQRRRIRRPDEMRVLDDGRTGELSGTPSDNLLIHGDSRDALRSLLEMPEFAEQVKVKVKVKQVYIEATPRRIATLRERSAGGRSGHSRHSRSRLASEHVRVHTVARRRVSAPKEVPLDEPPDCHVRNGALVDQITQARKPCVSVREKVPGDRPRG